MPDTLVNNTGDVHYIFKKENYMQALKSGTNCLKSSVGVKFLNKTCPSHSHKCNSPKKI